MGIYLSPRTDDVAVLEQLAGVPAGTHQRLLEVDAKYPGRDLADRDGYDQAQAYYKEIFGDLELNALDDLRTYGFGRIHPAVSVIVQEAGKDTQAGTILHAGCLMRQIIAVQGVDLNGVPIEMLQGVSWG